MRVRVKHLLARLSGHPALSRLLRNASGLLVAQVIAVLLGAVQYPLTVRLLGLDGYGQLGLVVSWVAVISQFVSIRLRETIVNYLTKYEASNDTDGALAIVRLSYLIDTAITIAFAVLVFTTAPVAATYVLRLPDAAPLIGLEGLHLLLTFTAGASTAIVLVFDRVRWLTVYQIAGTVLTFVLVVGVLLLDGSVAGYILASAISAGLQTLILFVKAQQLLQHRFKQHWWGVSLSPLRAEQRLIFVLLFSMNLDAARKILLENADVLVLGWFVGNTATVGLYKLAKQLAGYLSRLTVPIYNLVYPEVARLFASDPPALWPFLGRLTRFMLLGLLGGGLALALFAYPLIPLIFGAEFAPAIPLFLITAATNLWLVFIWAPGLLVTLGRARDLTIINLVSSGSMFLVALLLTPRWEALGAALALNTHYILWTVFIGVYLIRLPGFDAQTVLRHLLPARP